MISRTDILLILAINVNCSFSYDLKNNTVFGKRLVGAMVHSKGMMGKRMCIEDCIKRKTDCLSVNYNLVKLTCEFNNVDDAVATQDVLMINDKEYTFLNVTATLLKASNINTCSAVECDEWNTCSVLTSGRTSCMNVTKPVDCADLYAQGAVSDGVYYIYPSSSPIRAYCYMTVDGGGWTAFLKRFNGRVDFYRNWTEYRDGFGAITSEYWLGNENIHNIVSKGDSELKVVRKYFNEEWRYEKLSVFSVGNESSKYQVKFSGFSENIDNCWENYHNDLAFTTYDNDNDHRADVNCAVQFHGGWWYRNCYCINPTGLYGQKKQYDPKMMVSDKEKRFLKSFKMMTRRKNG